LKDKSFNRVLRLEAQFRIAEKGMVIIMETAKLFMNGGSQAVRLPKNFRFEGDEVNIKNTKDGVLLFPKRDADDAWERFLNSPSISEDMVEAILEDRKTHFYPERETL
jgi:antitoxin VapB